MNYVKFDKEEQITGIGQSAIIAKGSGSVTLTNYQGYKYTLMNVLYVPSAEMSIISFVKARKQGLQLEFNDDDNFSLICRKTSLNLPRQILDNILYVQEEKQPIKSYAISTRVAEKWTLREKEPQGIDN